MIFDIERNILDKHNEPEWKQEKNVNKMDILRKIYDLENSMFDFSPGEFIMDEYYKKREKITKLRRQLYDIEFPPLCG